MVSRRRVLAAGMATATGVTGAALVPTAATPAVGAERAGAEPAADTGALATTPFTQAMPLPRVLSPVSSVGGLDVYVMTMKPAMAEILPGIRTRVLTFDGAFPGPLIKARRGRPVVIHQRNRLDVPTSVHLHGGEVAQEHDGQPMETIAPGQDRTYFYPNNQPHASLWYHDHAHHLESENVYRGLSGSYLLTDDHEESLPLPTGEYDLPIAVRDANIDETGLHYTMSDRQRSTMLANGKAYPYVEVAARKYRIRFLNCSNQRYMELGLEDGSEMVQIGSDGGLLPRPHSTATLPLSAAERADVVIDFSRYPVGSSVVLKNSGGFGNPELVGQVLRFDIVRTAEDNSSVPSVLRELPPLPQPTAERTVTLRMDEDGRADPHAYIDEKLYDPSRVDQQIRFGASEVWTVKNLNQLAWHNFHMHLVQFRVLERDGRAPGPGEAGLKDTVNLRPNETVKVQATFDAHRGSYVYHCHMLDHSAMGMMATMKIS
ncbi:multicopper oxidase family protein [Streptomyces sp. MAR4 CNX-425]|uniref:multicopper oxidase family protein n=1 Tax=Streptomyces sp. MAR4 CNX-425 TaxID=3406343 RepID=UPI003B513457